MRELVHPTPPVIPFNMQAYTVSHFPHIVYCRTFIFIKDKTVTCVENTITYPIREINLDLLQKTKNNILIIFSKNFCLPNISL